MSANKRGKPTKERQLSIFEKMMNCFDEGLSAPAAARKHSIDPKTAYSYYDQIIEQYKEKTFDDLLERQERERVQVIATLDKDIEEATQLLEQIREDKKSYLEKRKPVPKHLFDQEIETMKYRSTIKDRKANYVIKPTPSEAYDIYVEEDEKREKDGKTG